MDIYNYLKKCRDYGLCDQLQKSVVSIPSNIAEGYERDTNKEFIRFLYIDKGSSAELRTQLHIALEFNIVDQKIGIQLIDRMKKLSSVL